jgi:endonuclease YncB( thermonuclease family)
MTDRELMQMALDALEDADRFLEDEGYSHAFQGEAIEALRERVSQPEREWVGLTDEDRYKAEACCWYMDEFDQTIYAEAIEAKLKEKNCG